MSLQLFHYKINLKQLLQQFFNKHKALQQPNNINDEEQENDNDNTENNNDKENEQQLNHNLNSEIKPIRTWKVR